MSTAIAKLLRELGESWRTLRPLPSLEVDQFERWSLEAAQALEVVGNLNPSHAGFTAADDEIDSQLLQLADRCRLLGDCNMSIALAEAAAERFGARGDRLNECRAQRTIAIGLQVDGSRDVAARRLAEISRTLQQDFPQEPLVGIVLSDYAQCLDDCDEATRLHLESLQRLEQLGKAGFEHATGRSFEIERSRRHASIAEARLRLMWDGDLEAARFAAEEERVRQHLQSSCHDGIPAVDLAEVGVLEAELALVTGRRERGLELLRALEQQAHEDSAIGGVLAPTYSLLARHVATEGDRQTAVEYCRRALLASLHFGNRSHEPLAAQTFIEIMKDTPTEREDSPEVAQLAKVLIEMLEAKDWYTGRNHSQSVGSLAFRIGKALAATGHVCEDEESLDWLDLRVLRLAGQLHDVGKLLIPWSLLNKINPLTDGEFAHVRSHAERGEEILQHLGLSRVARVAGQHHERCDGRGYPRGTSEITLMGATVAVADAFEAMITPNRRYRSRMTRDEAVAELVRCQGTMFDPRPVQALVGMFSRSTREVSQ